MFLGEHQHNLDAKGRVTLPARFRELLGSDAVLSRGKDGCLSLHRRAEWEVIAAGQRELMRRGATERTMARSFFSAATPVTPDAQGRIAIPPLLRGYAGLEKEVVVTGVYDYIEIWDVDRFREVEGAGAAALSSGAVDDFGL
ncbi:MAG: transcriptional regulator MraZ [Actinomycetota bacterium]|nr:transcriptional regulator MraZ [Actinomycetota bacterium]